MSTRIERRDSLENDARVAMGALFVEMDNLRTQVERLTRERDEARAAGLRLREAIRDAGLKREPGLYEEVMRFDAALPTPPEQEGER